MKSNLKKAFTLIELLVVITIISILSGVAIVGLSSMRGKAQDVTRLSDIRQLQLALAAYKSVNGHYPDAPGTSVSDSEEYIIGLVPGYIQKLPSDPSRTGNANNGYKYWVSDDKKTYCLNVWFTVYNSDSQPDLKILNNSYPNTWQYCSNGYRGDTGVMTP